jgi:MFS family permease
VLASVHGNPKFRLLWLSNLFFFGGAWTQTLVLGWFIFTTTQSEFDVALFTTARMAPMLAGPFTGAFADRHNRPRLLIVATCWALGASIVVAALVSADLAPFWALLLGGLAIGLAQSPSQPARSSLVLDLVGREHLSNANALNSMAMNATQVIGPALGGVMITLMGVPTTLWISAAWYAIALVTVLPLRGTGTVHASGAESTARMVASGLRAIARNRLAATVLLVTVAANVFLWPVYQSFMPVFAEESLGMGAGGLGALLTCAGAGGLVGSLVIARMGDFRYKGGVFVFGTLAWALLWAIFGMSRSPVLSFVLMAGIGVLGAAFGVLQTTLLLMTTGPAVHGRALGLQELAIGAMPLASVALGAIAQHVGAPLTTTVAALLLATCLVALAVVTPTLLPYSGRPPVRRIAGSDDLPVADGAAARTPAI